MLNIVLFGPPGSGKGTQSEKIIGQYGLTHFSTGDMLRAELAAETELGLRARSIMEKGELVSDEIIIGMIRNRISGQADAKGFIFDGFPRTVAQAEALDKTLTGMGLTLEYVFNIDVGDEELVKRLTGRRICKACGMSYHLVFNPPREDGRCDACQGDLYQRDDDKEDTIRNRLKVYQAQTAPLIDFYQEKNILSSIDGVGTIEQITERLKTAVSA